MFGGIAIRGNLLCVAYSDARGKVFLVDVDERRPVSFFEYAGDAGYADAGGVAIDDASTIWLADTKNERVRRFTIFGKQIGEIGAHDDAPAHAQRRDRTGVLNRPRAVATLDDVVLVACGEGELVRGAQRFLRNGTALPPLAAFGDKERSFGAPRGIWADARGVLVADTLHGVVQRFTAGGRYVSSFATARAGGETSRPVAVLALADESIVIADLGDRPGLVRFAKDGRVRHEARAAEAHLHEPVALACDAQQRVYVLDRDGERVQRWLPDLRPDSWIVDLAEFLYGQ